MQMGRETGRKRGREQRFVIGVGTLTGKENSKKSKRGNEINRAKEKGKDSGYSEKSRHHSSRGRSEYPSAYSSSHEKEKERHRHCPYT
ncbi:hypothetical protein CKAN_02290400 [Cinnamomum micranthum f. kanehirae]|uniref:Uncharacterized protein n=1 Tax=Cinnamomum micranthum f. kanehirae TaxID=337451 RepID=A0A443PS85_9MAGN|nr:hypothetical protein CKAN_02290400 [Cinnamomum micranthum f. kanehirae]